MFRNRIEAGRLLGDKLRDKYYATPVVLALVKGGLPVAEEVAKALNAPMDILLVRRIELPGRSEVTVGAVCEGEGPIFNHELLRGLELTPAMMEPFVQEKQKEILVLRQQLPIHGNPIDIKGKDAIIVDDSIASGMSALMAIKAVRLKGAATVTIAAPVVDRFAIARIADAKVETIALEIAEHLITKNLYADSSETYTQTAHPD